MTLVKMISLKLSARAHLQQLPMSVPYFSPGGRNSDDDDDDEAKSVKHSKMNSDCFLLLVMVMAFDCKW